jgi:hypothetical protein
MNDKGKLDETSKIVYEYNKNSLQRCKDCYKRKAKDRFECSLLILFQLSSKYSFVFIQQSPKKTLILWQHSIIRFYAKYYFLVQKRFKVT